VSEWRLRTDLRWFAEAGVGFAVRRRPRPLEYFPHVLKAAVEPANWKGPAAAPFDNAAYQTCTHRPVKVVKRSDLGTPQNQTHLP
jgi:hypothetical protein